MIVATEPVGFETKIPRRVTSSPVSKTPSVAVDAAEVNPTALARAEPIRPVAGAAIVTAVTSFTVPSAALAGATEVNTPKPKAATATSATRLKVVFVDICFLSISRLSDDPSAGFG